MEQTNELSGPEIARRLLALMREHEEFCRGVAALRRRGISPKFIRYLIDTGEAALPQVRVLVGETITPAPRKGVDRLWWRLRVKLGATDPHDVRRAEVAAFVARFNASGAAS